MIVQTSEDGLVFRLSDHTPDIVRQILLERGWSEYDETKSKNDGEWNLWWRTQRFRRSEHNDIAPWQRLNHFPSTDAITRKDCLVRNLRRMRCVHGSSVYDFHPLSYILPNEYTKFVTDYAKESQKNGGKDLYWICKPTDLSRGRGIFVFKDLKDLNYDCPVIVQRYISSPLLISGYKFDLRIYVCVPSFFPLTIYIYQEGIVRFGTDKFDLNQLGNVFSHLTNTSINKYGPAYATDKERVGPGCKWTLSQLRSFLRQMDNFDEMLLWQRISNIVTLTIATQAPTVPKSQSCFELFGFDILIDENFKPWLLEVNFSPALSMDCQADFIAKHSLISDLIDLLNFKESDSMRGGKSYRDSSNPSGEYSSRRGDSQSPHEEGPALNYMYSKPKLSKYSPMLTERSKFIRRSNTNSSTRSNESRTKVTPQNTPRQHWHSRLTNSLDSKQKKDKSGNDKLPRITKNVDSDKEDTKSSDSGVSSSSSIPRNLSSSSMASSQSSIDNMSKNEEEESNHLIGNQNFTSSPGLNESSRWIVGSDRMENDRTMLSAKRGCAPSPKLNRSPSNRSSFTKRTSSKHCVKTKTLPRIHQRNMSQKQGYMNEMSPRRSTRTAPSGEDILGAKSESNANKLFPIAEVNNVPMSKLSLDTVRVKDSSEVTHSLSSRAPEMTPKGLRKKKNITSAPHSRLTDVLRSGDELKENNGKRSTAGGMLQSRGSKKKLASTYRSPYSIYSTASTKTTSNPWPRTRVGDFVLTFPWNETLRKASGTNFDMKTIIKEQQSILKKLYATSSLSGNRKRRESVAITKSEAIELSFMLKFEDKDSNPLYFWGSQNPPLLSSVLS